MKLPTLRELDTIRGKLLSGPRATQKETKQFLAYVTALEELVTEASMEDFYGTEGWKHRLNIDDG